MNSFGIVIACCKADIYCAKGCLASIRHFLQDVPVCFLVDGPASLCDSIKKNDPHVIVLSNDALHNPWLRKVCRGWGHTKMAALWEAPFDTCLYLDADTCVWGDILSIIPDREYDFIIDDPQKIYSDTEILKYFFHTAKLSVHFPEFDYGAYRDRYAITGTFFFRRGAVDLASYQQTWALQEEDDLFSQGEQGMFNFLVFHSVQRKELRVHNTKFQVMRWEEQMRLEYSPLCLTGKKPLKPAVLHFARPKPHIFTRSGRAATMNHFRQQYLIQIEGLPRWTALWRMALEDIQYIRKDIRWHLTCRLKRGLRKRFRWLSRVPLTMHVRSKQTGYIVYVDLLRNFGFVARRQNELEEFRSFALLLDRFHPETFWDVGANIGRYSLFFLSRRRNGSVLAFEPDVRNLDLFNRTVRRNALSSIKIVPKAVAGRAGETTFFLDDIHGATGTIIPNHFYSFILHRYGATPKSMRVQTTTLDEQLRDNEGPDLIKIDIEGAELSALEGGRRMLERYLPVILYRERASINPIQTATLLKNLGYRLFNPRTFYPARTTIALHEQKHLGGQRSFLLEPDNL